MKYLLLLLISLNLFSEEFVWEKNNEIITQKEYAKAIDEYIKQKYPAQRSEYINENGVDTTQYVPRPIRSSVYSCNRIYNKIQKRSCIKSLALNDNVDAQLELANYYIIDRNYALADKWLEKVGYSANYKFLPNIEKLIMALINRKDYERYAYWLKRYISLANSSQDTKILSKLTNKAIEYKWDKKNVKKDRVRFYNIIKEVGKYNYDRGRNELGIAYELSFGTSKNLTKAFNLYSISAKNNNAFGLSKLGYFYYNEGYGRRDLAKAYDYFVKAANKGDNYSMGWLGYLHEFGIYVKKDYKKAKQWYTKSNNSYSKNRLEKMRKEGKI